MKEKELRKIRQMLQELLLEHSLTKKELCDFIKMSKHKFNAILSHFDVALYINAQQTRQIFKIYYRFKAYEYEMKKYLPDSLPDKKKKNQSSD
jgi:hypothetical protein